jgi:hypothetical protein
MLSVCRKGDYLTGTKLKPAEGWAMRKAFDRFAVPEFRQAAWKSSSAARIMATATGFCAAA